MITPESDFIFPSHHQTYIFVPILCNALPTPWNEKRFNTWFLNVFGTMFRSAANLQGVPCMQFKRNHKNILIQSKRGMRQLEIIIEMRFRNQSRVTTGIDCCVIMKNS